MHGNKTIKYILIPISGMLTFVILLQYLKNAKSYDLVEVRVILTARVLKDDAFQLFYRERLEPKFSIEKSVRTKAKGANDFQEIAFELPKINDFHKLRLDIGENQNQKRKGR